MYLVVLGLGLALVPRSGGPLAQPTDAARGVATVLAGLLLLRAGAFPRGRTYLAEHVLAAVPPLWGAFASFAAPTASTAVILTIVALSILVLPFTPRADEVEPWHGRPPPQLLALALGGMAVGWGALALVTGAASVALLRGYGLDPVPFWVLAVATGSVVVVQELTPLPASWRWPAQVACGVVLLAYALAVPLRVPSAYWVLNTATIWRSAALLALPLLRGRPMLETNAYADRLTVALVISVMAPLTLVMAGVMHLVGESAITAAQRNAVLGAALGAGIAFSGVARLQARALTAELAAFSRRVASSVAGSRGPLVHASAGTELRRVGARLEELLDELDERAKERAALLQRLRRQNVALSEANAAKDEFLNLVSHELRTPLTIVAANARLLEARGSRLPPDEVRMALADVRTASERLEMIVDDLLTLARPEQGLGLELQPLRVLSAVREAMDVHERLHPQRRVHVEAPEEQLIANGDFAALVAVLVNLLSNAEKYSPPQGVIEVEVCRFGPHVRIVIADRGIGISTAEAARLFEPFYRGADVAEAAPGLGVGLAVSRKLMLAMGGAIAGHPRLGGGAEFEVLLPLPHLMTVD
ncbi:MAG: HAMP domain-containing sensor histidine kinase [Dehalococcoidia bacterium]